MKHILKATCILALAQSAYAPVSFGQEPDCPPVAVGMDSPCLDKWKADQAAAAKAEADAKAKVPELSPRPRHSMPIFS